MMLYANNRLTFPAELLVLKSSCHGVSQLYHKANTCCLCVRTLFIGQSDILPHGKKVTDTGLDF